MSLGNNQKSQGARSWCPSWSNSLWISCLTPLKPQRNSPNPNPLANQLWCIDSLTPPSPLIIPHHPSQTPCLPWISYATQKLMLDSCKMVQKQSEAFHTLFLWHFFLSLKQNFIAYRSSKVSSRPDCIFEIHQLWQSGCSCSFEPEIIKFGQSSHNMRINFFYSLRTFCPHLGSFFFCVVSSFTTFLLNFTSGLLQVIYCDLG